jgi:lipid II:glycine glycyltransferase (peptidoglycan interpeptide bridge formation enzyme)
MIEFDYQRWGILRSKAAYFADYLPSTEGYHFIFCRNCYDKLPSDPLFKCVTQHTVVLDLSQDSDRLFAQIDNYKRKVLKRALKVDFDIINLSPTIGLLNEFRSLYNKSIAKKGATPIFSLNYLKALIPFMTIFKGDYEGNTLEIMILIHDGQTVRAHYLAHNENYPDKQIRGFIGSVIFWKAIMHFKEQGYQTFDFGGINLDEVSSSQGFTKFKLSFGGEICPNYWYEAAVTPTAQTLMKARNILERSLRRLRS